MSEPPAQPDWIIVADSEVIVRNALSEYLRHCGYKVIDAANAEEVLVILETGTAAISIILCDADLGGETNPFALRLLVRHRWPDIDFILAGNVATAAKAAGELCEQGPHLSRPYDPQAVLNRIMRRLGAARS